MDESAEQAAESRPKPWKSLVALIGLGYTLFLFTGSIPEWMRWNEDVEKIVIKVRKTFYKARGKPGLPVFHGTLLPEWVPNHMCLIVAGRDPGGEWERVYESYDDCEYPTFRWKVNHFNLVFSGVTGVGKLEGLARKGGEYRPKAVRALRHRSSLDGAMSYFCAESGLTEVHLIAHTSAVHYKSGKRREHAEIIHSLHCETKRRLRPEGRIDATLVDGKVVIE